jgi:hypothetical protein
MIVVEHRPPLRRIELGARPPPVSAPAVEDIYAAARATEHDRIWRLIEQASQGQGSGCNEC